MCPACLKFRVDARKRRHVYPKQYPGPPPADQKQRNTPAELKVRQRATGEPECLNAVFLEAKTSQPESMSRLKRSVRIGDAAISATGENNLEDRRE